jgi:hypothetical protein
MSSKLSIVPAIVAFFVIISVAAPSSNAAPPDDPCALLTQAQVSASAHVPVFPGSPLAPTDKKVCAWPAAKRAPKSVELVTLMLQTPASFRAGKSAPVGTTIVMTPVAGLGDDAYYLALEDNVSLFVRKGNVVFKLGVLGDISIADKQAMEKTLARQVVSKL